MRLSDHHQVDCVTGCPYPPAHVCVPGLGMLCTHPGSPWVLADAGCVLWPPGSWLPVPGSSPYQGLLAAHVATVSDALVSRTTLTCVHP